MVLIRIKGVYLILLMFVVVSCSVTSKINYVNPQKVQHKNPLFVITYDENTKIINRKLKKELEGEFKSHQHTASFILQEGIIKDTILLNDTLLVNKMVKKIIAVSTSDLIVLIQPSKVVLQIPGMAITRVNYHVYCITQSNEVPSLHAEILSKNYFGGNISINKTANEIIKQLVDVGLIDGLMVEHK